MINAKMITNVQSSRTVHNSTATSLLNGPQETSAQRTLPFGGRLIFIMLGRPFEASV